MAGEDTNTVKSILQKLLVYQQRQQDGSLNFHKAEIHTLTNVFKAVVADELKAPKSTSKQSIRSKEMRDLRQ